MAAVLAVLIMVPLLLLCARLWRDNWCLCSGFNDSAEDEFCDDCAGDALAVDGHSEENNLKMQWRGDNELL